MAADKPLKAEVLSRLQGRGFAGATVAELREATGRHHGHVSGALSFLHAGKRIARLSDKRGGCKVYVTPEFVDGRPTERQGRR